MTTRSSLVGAALGTLIVALRCGTSSSSSSSSSSAAFLVDVNAAGRRADHHRHWPPSSPAAAADATTSRGGVPNGGRRMRATTTTTTTTTTTRLSMIAKSGGRLILSAEQFEREVLSSSPSSSSDADGAADAAGIADDDGTLPALVLFTAPWCGPCRLATPVVGEILAQYRGRVRVLEMSTDDLPDVAMDAGVRSIPTILIYHGGEVRDTIVGCVARNVLARAVDKVLEDLGRL